MIDIYHPRALLSSKLLAAQPPRLYRPSSTTRVQARARATTDTVIEALEVEGNPPPPPPPSPVDTAIMKIENKGSFAATRRPRPATDSIDRAFYLSPSFLGVGGGRGGKSRTC